MSLTILPGDCRETLATLPSESVQCVVTSPPYYGLRNYGCAGQIGLEQTPEAFVAEIVAVFREVRRVLKADGTLWLNLGDSYANDTKWGGSSSGKHVTALHGNSGIGRCRHTTGLASKNLIGIPWRVAFALQADGWILRQDIIWAKPNPMPESVTDRCTKSHEYLFLLSKSPSYYFDADAIKEDAVYRDDARPFGGAGGDRHGDEGRVYDPRAAWKGSEFHTGKTSTHQLGRSSKKRGEFNGKTNALPGREAFRAFTLKRNKRSVWTVSTKPYKEAHFATFPPDLIRPCVLAGSRAGDTILDPFAGSGTSGQVAMEEGREAILCELNPAYCDLIRRRCSITPGFSFTKEAA